MMLNIDLTKISEEARKSGEKIPAFLVSLEISVQDVVDQYNFSTFQEHPSKQSARIR